MRTAGRIAGLCLSASIWLASTAPVTAQEGEDAEYHETLAEAVAEYNAGHYAEARALFRRAHRMSPSARTLRGLGMASFELREYVEALRSLRAALAFDERPLTDEQREHVEGLIDRTNAYVGRYRVELSPSDAELLVDDAPATLNEDGALVLNLGSHTLEARCPGCEAEHRTVRVRGGEDEALRFELTRSTGLAGGGASDPSDGGAIAGDPTRQGGGSSDGSTAGLVLVVGAGVLAAASAGGVVWWIDRNDELDRCEQAGDACSNEDALTVERGIAAAVTVGLGVAAVGALVGGLILLGGDDEEGDVAFGCVPEPTGVSCAGRF